jgi:hypothetical protein
MQAILKKLIDWALATILPMLKDFLIKLIKSAKINREVKKEFDELEQIKREANEWCRRNPGKPLPKDIELRLRAVARKRVSGLQ